MEERKIIGNVNDSNCLQRSIQVIVRRQYRNNCKYWKNKKCELGY